MVYAGTHITGWHCQPAALLSETPSRINPFTMPHIVISSGDVVALAD